MRFLVVQHNMRSPAGLVGERILARGHRLEVTMPHLGGPLPERPDGHAGLLVLGGEMSAADDDGFPHYRPLRNLVRRFDESGRPVMGLCLGAQIIARAYGASVYRHTIFEFGYHELAATAAGRMDPLLAGIDPMPRLMQYHDDTFDLPAEAVHLVSGANCANQGFRVGDHVYAFQFHLETTDDTARAWALYPEAAAARGGESASDAIERELDAHYGGAAEFARTVTDRWLDLAADG
jgi:GMP synthase-like glutamine amidotransferase